MRNLSNETDISQILDFVEVLLDNGADPDFIDGELGKSEFWPKKAQITNSNVHRAVEYGKLDIVKMLVGSHADVSVKSAQNNGPIHAG